MSGANSRPNSHTVNARRPAGYVGAAALFAAIVLIVSGTGIGATPPPAGAAQAQAPAATPPPPCTGLKDSLRPTGPLPPPGAMPEGSKMAAIFDRGRLVAGVDQGKYLAGFRDPITGELRGNDIEVVRQIATAIFGNPDMVQYVVLDIADRPTAVAEHRVDLVVNSFTVTCERQKIVEFSSTYMEASQRILVPKASKVKEVEDLAGKRVCTSRGSTTETVLKALPIGLDVMTLSGIPDCVVELQRGRVAAVSSDDMILAGLAAQDPQTEVVGRPLDQQKYAVGIHPDSPDLVRFVNGVLEKARADGSMAANFQKWLGGHLKPLPQPAPAIYRD